MHASDPAPPQDAAFSISRRGALPKNGLNRTPHPLISLRYNIGILWSAKSACTKVVTWFLSLHDLLPAAMFYHHWPHTFRTQVLYKSATYRAWLDEVDPNDLVWYQFARDPIKRALSSYRHNLRYGYRDKHIASALGRPISPDEGYSLNEFLDYLDATDLDGRCDIHVKLQRHPYSHAATVINIDSQDMYAAMNQIEAEIGAAPTDFERASAFSRIDATHNAKSLPLGEVIDPNRRLSRKDAIAEWVVRDSVLDAPTRARISTLYKPDLAFITDRAGPL